MSFDKKKPKQPRLKKRERVLATCAGKPIDKRPFTFSYPFGLTHMKGESLAAAALSFAAEYGIDLLRFPAIRDLPVKEQTSLDRPHDLTQLPELSGLAGFWAERFEALKATARIAEGRLAIFESVPEPYTALSYICPPEILSQAEKNHLNFLDKALSTVRASLENYLSSVLKENCVDGIVVEIESATFEQREPNQFESLIKPHLKEMLNFITSESEVPIWLHIRGTRLYIKPLLDLPHQILSWPHLSQGPKLEKALPKRYPGVVAGGIDEQALRTMSFQEIRRHVEEARDYKVSVLSPGDLLTSDMSPSRLQALSNFLKKRDRLPEEEDARERDKPVSIIDEP